MQEDRRFYVYMWYFKDTGEVFHVGKGTGNRYKEKRIHRNQYFQNVVNKYPENVDVKIYKDNLTEEEAWILERQMISYYWSIGQCKTNLHEGGKGGYTGNYDSPERSRKISEALTGRPRKKGPDNPLYGTHLSEETKKKISKALKGKPFSEEHRKHLAEANRKQVKSQEEIDRIANLNKGKKMSAEVKAKMMQSLCPYEYQVYLNDELQYTCLGQTDLINYCKQHFNISREIVYKVLAQTWKPTFNKHLWLSTLKILKIERCIDQG